MDIYLSPDRYHKLAEALANIDPNEGSQGILEEVKVF
jgi:hypothetical protein